ncbi:unnamed protein product, partial [Phaeothamnion confervicola]
MMAAERASAANARRATRTLMPRRPPAPDLVAMSGISKRSRSEGAQRQRASVGANSTQAGRTVHMSHVQRTAEGMDTDYRFCAHLDWNFFLLSAVAFTTGRAAFAAVPPG